MLTPSQLSAPARLALFGLVLVAVFATTFVVAGAVVPDEVARDQQVGTGAGHRSGPGTGDHGDGDHEEGGDGGHAAGSEDDDQHVAGLSASADGVRLVDVAAPARTSEPGELTFSVLDADGAPVRELEVSHEKRLHLVVVRSDGEGFRHVHPEQRADGSWAVDWEWTLPGSYRVYTDLVPAATGANVVLTSTVEVAGELEPVQQVEHRAVEVDGYQVTADGELVAGAESELVFTVRRDGRPVTDLQRHLGASGHLVALRSGDLGYLHVHPTGDAPAAGELAGPEVVFAATAPTPGRYLLYLDLRIDGVVRSFPLVVDAA